jgi:hypothetical protein
MRQTRKPTGKTIDFRHLRWGHNLSIRADKKPGRYTGSCWSTPRPNRGDKILWASQYGTVEAVVLDVDYCRDPDDMAFIKVKVTNRKQLIAAANANNANANADVRPAVRVRDEVERG